MRHPGNVCEVHITGHVLTKGRDQWMRGISVLRGREEGSEADGRPCLVWYLDTDKRLAWDRGFHADRTGFESQLEFLLQARDTSDADTLGRLERVAGDRGATFNRVHFNRDAEVGECSLDGVRVGFHVADIGLATFFIKKREGRSDIGATEVFDHDVVRLTFSDIRNDARQAAYGSRRVKWLCLWSRLRRLQANLIKWLEIVIKWLVTHLGLFQDVLGSFERWQLEPGIKYEEDRYKKSTEEDDTSHRSTKQVIKRPREGETEHSTVAVPIQLKASENSKKKQRGPKDLGDTEFLIFLRVQEYKYVHKTRKRCEPFSATKELL